MVGRTREPALLNSGTVSVLCVPLVRDERLLGLITLGAGAADRFNDADAALLGRFATPAANAIANAQRYEAAVFLLDRTTPTAPARRDLRRRLTPEPPFSARSALRCFSGPRTSRGPQIVQG